jgi:hypothetical protein
MSVVDKDSGEIDFEEFAKMMLHQQQPHHGRRDMIRIVADGAATSSPCCAQRCVYGFQHSVYVLHDPPHCHYRHTAVAGTCMISAEQPRPAAKAAASDRAGAILACTHALACTRIPFKALYCTGTQQGSNKKAAT